MGILSEVMAIREKEKADRNANMTALINAIPTFMQSQRQAELIDLDKRKTMAEISNLESTGQLNNIIKGISMGTDLVDIGVKTRDMTKVSAGKQLINQVLGTDQPISPIAGTVKSLAAPVQNAISPVALDNAETQVSQEMQQQETTPGTITEDETDKQLLAWSEERDPFTGELTEKAKKSLDLWKEKQSQQIKATTTPKQQQQDLQKAQLAKMNLDFMSGKAENLPSGYMAMMTNLANFITRGNAKPELATYAAQRPAMATAIYRDVTGDTRLSDKDAQTRALPLLWRPDESTAVKQLKFSDLQKLYEARVRLISQGKYIKNPLPDQSGSGQDEFITPLSSVLAEAGLSNAKKESSGIKPSENKRDYESQFSPETQELLKMQRSAKPDLYSEVVSPLLSGVNTFALNVPKAALRTEAAMGDEASALTLEAMYPEQKTAAGKVIRGISEAVGWTAGLPGKVFASAARYGLGKASGKAALEIMAKEALRQKMKRGAVAGLASAAVSAPDQFSLEAEGKHLLMNAATGAIIPFAGAVIGKVGSFVDATGKVIQNAVFGSKIADYARTRGWNNLLNPEYWGDKIPTNIKRGMVNFFNNARNNVGQKLDTLINSKKYSNIHHPYKDIEKKLYGLLGEIDDPTLNISAKEKSFFGEIFTMFQKDHHGDEFIPISKLWNYRKIADKMANDNFSSPGAKQIWSSLRRVLNDPIKNAGKDIFKQMKKYEYIMSVMDDFGTKFEGIVNKESGAMYSPKVASFLEGLFTPKGSAKAKEIITMLSEVDGYQKLDDMVLDDALDWAAAQAIKNEIGQSVRGGYFRLLDQLAMKPTMQVSAMAEKIGRIPQAGGRFLRGLGQKALDYGRPMPFTRKGATPNTLRLLKGRGGSTLVGPQTEQSFFAQAPAGKSGASEFIKLEQKILSKTDIPEQDIVKYVQSSVADGAKLRTYADDVVSGKMSVSQAASKVKADYNKLIGNQQESGLSTLNKLGIKTPPRTGRNYKPYQQLLSTGETTEDFLKLAKINPKGKTPAPVLRELMKNPEFRKKGIFDKIKIVADIERTGRGVPYGNTTSIEQNKKQLGSKIVGVDTIRGCDNCCVECYGNKLATKSRINHSIPVKATVKRTIPPKSVLRVGVTGDPATDWIHTNNQMSKVIQRSKAHPNQLVFVTKLQNIDGFDNRIVRNMEVSIDPFNPEHMRTAMENVKRIKSSDPSMNIYLRIRSFKSNNAELNAELEKAISFANQMDLPVLETRMRFLKKDVMTIAELDDQFYERVGNQFKAKGPFLKGRVNKLIHCDLLGEGCPTCKNCAKVASKGVNAIMSFLFGASALSQIKRGEND